MIKGILVINNHGKPRLVKFYQGVTGEDEQQSVIRRIFQQVSQRQDSRRRASQGQADVAGDVEAAAPSRALWDDRLVGDPRHRRAHVSGV